MLSHPWSFARSGVIALAALASLSPAASGAPLGPVGDRAVADNSPNKPILVWQGEGRDFGPGYRVLPRGRWGGGGGNWGGRWGGGGHWRHGGWGHGGYGWGGWGSGFALGLGLGLPLGYYGGGGYYDNYVPYRPRYYAPRSYYRGGGGGHVEWCYSRYRSYRAWDNSWQPNYGSRRQCISPYD